MPDNEIVVTPTSVEITVTPTVIDMVVTTPVIEMELTQDVVELVIGDNVRTALDKIATNLDVISTHADVVLTHADVISTHADAEYAALTAASVNSIVEQISEDLLTVSGYASQTAKDVLSTAADALATQADVDTIDATVLELATRLISTQAIVVLLVAFAPSMNDYIIKPSAIPDTGYVWKNGVWTALSIPDVTRTTLEIDSTDEVMFGSLLIPGLIEGTVYRLVVDGDGIVGTEQIL